MKKKYGKKNQKTSPAKNKNFHFRDLVVLFFGDGLALTGELKLKKIIIFYKKFPLHTHKFFFFFDEKCITYLTFFFAAVFLAGAFLADFLTGEGDSTV